MLRKKIGSFYLVKRLGSGPLSEMFLAINPRTREKRAYKVFAKSASVKPSVAARFLREADSIRLLEHPGVLRVFDSGIFENSCFYAMEFVPGGSLERLLKRGRMQLDTASELFSAICAAVAHAHAKGILHRNLKPSNVLFNAAGNPLVSDFGIAKALELERNVAGQPGTILGAIAYLAPERRFASPKPSQREDVYALGAIFYEMLMGFPPLGKFPWPIDVQPDFPPRLQSVLEKCLAPEPEKRFEHASRLHAELAKCREWTAKSMPAHGLPESDFPPDDRRVPQPVKMDRIEAWFRVLRNGTARERLNTVRNMIDGIEPPEAKAILKLYACEGDRVRWGLIRVLGELKIQAATALILTDLRNPFHTEYALEALGKIGSDEAYNVIREYVVEHPESAVNALVPLARTGKQRSIRNLRRYLNHEKADLRQAAARGLAAVVSGEALHVLKERLCVEEDEQVRISLFEAVNSLQAVLLPEELVVPAWPAAARARNSELPT